MTATCVLCFCLGITAADPATPPPIPPQELLLPAPKPLTPEPLSASVRPLTLEEFVGNFQPAAGNYEVVFLHPGSHKPVSVSFTLPAGTPKVRVQKREVAFDYGNREVRIRFRIFGKVAVITD